MDERTDRNQTLFDQKSSAELIKGDGRFHISTDAKTI